MPSRSADTEAGFRRIFRRAHADHLKCVDDEWLVEPCRLPSVRGMAGPPPSTDRPLVWSRRNGPWRQVDVLWVGAAPGNDGGRGAGRLGAHGTRIPFGGDVSGANLEVMLGSIGLDRNETFIAAALNQLPASGGGEPRVAEIMAPVGDYPDSIHLLRDTIIAAAPRLIIALGNVAARIVASAWAVERGPTRLVSLAAVRAAGWERMSALPLREIAARSSRSGRRAPDDDPLSYSRAAQAGTGPDPLALWLTHPSAQNMSPHAGVDTVFHTRMLEAIDVLRDTVTKRLGWNPPRERPEPARTGIYALPEWRDRIRQRNARLDGLWREKGV